MTALVFVVDDDADHRAAASDLIEAAGHEVCAFPDAAAALAALDRSDPGVIVTDLRMPGMDGMGFIAALAARGGDHPVVVITGHGDVPQAVQAIRAGAEDFLEKPYSADHLLLVIARALRARETRDELRRLRSRLPEEEIVGDSRAMAGLRAQVAALAGLDVNVLVTGETGTGKELVARALHAGGPRGAKGFVALNCAAVPESLFEIEMFGAAAGAFPGAMVDKPGKLELADGGTLLLDEIDSMPQPIQAKMLRVLEDRTITRLGEHRPRPLDIRVVSTSKVELKAMAFDGRFRADLYYRLAGAEIATAPLREMSGDIALLFAHFASEAARRYGRALPEIPISLRARLVRQSWPGNARELRAAAERFVLGLDPGGEGAPATSEGSGASLPERMAAFEAREIHAALVKCRGNTERAATLLGLPRRTLNDKIKRLGLTT
ncbi:sigma-54 dependent transcriptional regulator [Frigidibacter sp. RF13]|uniref:sigma-54-dependent transcriptional regulator n=1 Tax=Frigidibacter sp. RF13 TaxID=2997340 RepID=UPI002271BB7E|nr:sigma-54 dependent transcriptional regulator [Frigidibacter sp. RF13]MCY1128005.1 sigma-54 dependent transcriptional regulator [Frigidibacter sp. RF13]